MKTFIITCLFLTQICLSAPAQEKNGEALVKSYNAIIGDYWEKPVKDLPQDKREAILIAIAKKRILRNDKADYFGVQETPKIEYVKLKKGFYMPRDENLWGKWPIVSIFTKAPIKRN